MAYDKKKLYEQCVKAIEKNNLFFIEDIVAFIPCNKDTFYRLFPIDSDEYDTLRGMLENNKIQTKSSIRAKLYKGKGGDLLALYRMIATDSERRAISLQHVETIDKTEKPTKYIIVDAKEGDGEDNQG